MQHIMVIDDDDTTLEMIDYMLKKRGYQVTLWNAGAFAVEQVEQNQPDLVLLDNRLGYPGDGWGILQELRFNDATVRIPIILYSADHDFLRQKQVFIRGMGADVLFKPFDLDTLFQTIDTLLA